MGLLIQDLRHRQKKLNWTVKASLCISLVIPATLTNASLRSWTDNQCLATALHYEARGEPLKGKRAVYDTVVNRMLASGRSACSVVMQRGQFSWSKNKPLLKYDLRQQEMMGEVLSHPVVLKESGYTHFYSGRKPAWARGMVCKRIDMQTFCKGK